MKNWLLGAFALVSANFLGAQALSVQMDKINPTCFSYTNGIAIAMPSGGVLPYSFHWQNNQAGSQNWGLPVGNYSVTVTDATGATIVGSTTLTQPSKMVVDIDAVNVECADYQGTLTAKSVGGTPPYNYAWSTGTPAASTLIAGEGDYLVTVLDSKACHDVGTRYVEDPSQIFPNIILNQPATSHSQDGSITSQSIGNHMPHKFLWSNGTTTATISNLGPGTYTVSITDVNNCTKVESILLKAVISLDVSVNVTNSVCFNQDNGAVGAFVTGSAPPFTFVWTNSANVVVSDQAIVQNLSPDTYKVVVTDGDGNTATASGTVTEPTQLQVSFTLPPANCGTGTYTVPVFISGATPPYMVTNNGVPVSSFPLTGLLPNTYYYLCVMDANKCQKDVPFTTPDNVSLTAEMYTTYAACTGSATGTATVAASGGSGNYSYAWPAPAANLNTPSQNGLAVGTYVVTVTDNVHGCTALATGTIQTHTNIAVFVNAGDALCVGSATGIASASASNGTTPYTFSWSTGATDASITGLAPGFYPVTVSDASGCSTVSGANIGTQIMLDAAFLMQTVGCVGDDVEVKFVDQSTMIGQIDTWNWIFTSGSNGQTTSSSQTPSNMIFDKNQQITVQLSVSNSNGCADMQSSVLEISGQPIVVAPASVSGCDDAKITLVPDQTFYTYSWTGPNGFTSTNQNLTINQSGQYTVVVTAAAGCSTTLNIPASINPAVNLVAVETPINKCDDLSSLSATATGGGSMTYSWYVNGVLAGSGATFNADSLLNGLNQIICVAAQGGCSEADTVMVEAHPLSISLSGNDKPCVGQSAMVQIMGLDPNQQYTYNWSPTAPNSPQAPIPTPAAGSQNIAVTVTNSTSGCTATAAFVADVQSSTPLAGIKIKSCNGHEVTFTIDPAVKGTWNFGDGVMLAVTPPQISVTHIYTANGTFQATFIPDADCVAPFSANVIAKDLVIDALFINSPAGPCDTDISISFKSTSTGVGANGTYAWNFGTLGTSTSPNPNDILITQNGTYPVTLTVTNVDGCSDTYTTEVTITNLITPPNFTPNPATICEGDKISLNPNGNPTYKYVWSNGSTEPNPMVMPSSNSFYFVTISNGSSVTCTLVDTVSVNVNAAPTLSAAADQTVCSTAPIQLSATSNGSVKWSLEPDFTPSQDGTTYTVTPNATGTTTVYVQAETGLGCKKTDEVNIINGQPNINFDLAPQTICIKSSANLVINSTDPIDNLNAVWSPTLPDGLSQTVSPTAGTTYTAIVTNSPSGCTTTAAFTIGVIDLQAQIVNLMGKDTICPNESRQFGVNLTGGPAGGTYSYNWTGPNLDNENLEQPTASPNTSGEHMYMVQVTLNEAPGCIATSATYDLLFINPTCGEPYIFLPNAFTPNDGGDNQNDILYVRASAEITELLFIIYDRWGEEVFRTTDINVGWDGKFKDEILNPDSYGFYLKAVCSGGEVYQKQGNVTILR